MPFIASSVQGLPVGSSPGAGPVPCELPTPRLGAGYTADPHAHDGAHASTAAVCRHLLGDALDGHVDTALTDLPLTDLAADRDDAAGGAR